MAQTQFNLDTCSIEKLEYLVATLQAMKVANGDAFSVGEGDVAAVKTQFNGDRAALVAQFNTLMPQCVACGAGSAAIDAVKEAGGSVKVSYDLLAKAEWQGVQENLTALGFDTKGIDGVAGKNTQAALEAYAQSKGLSVGAVRTGQTINSAVLEAIRADAAIKAQPAADVAVTGGACKADANPEQTNDLLGALGGNTPAFDGFKTGFLYEKWGPESAAAKTEIERAQALVNKVTCGADGKPLLKIDGFDGRGTLVGIRTAYVLHEDKFKALPGYNAQAHEAALKTGQFTPEFLTAFEKVATSLPDNCCDPVTLAAAVEANKTRFGTGGLDAKVPTLSRGNAGNDVAEVRYVQTRLDCYKGEVDGVYGAGTEKAVKTVELGIKFAGMTPKGGIKADGIYTAATDAGMDKAEDRDIDLCGQGKAAVAEAVRAAKQKRQQPAARDNDGGTETSGEKPKKRGWIKKLVSGDWSDDGSNGGGSTALTGTGKDKDWCRIIPGIQTAEYVRKWGCERDGGGEATGKTGGSKNGGPGGGNPCGGCNPASDAAADAATDTSTTDTGTAAPDTGAAAPSAPSAPGGGDPTANVDMDKLFQLSAPTKMAIAKTQGSTAKVA